MFSTSFILGLLGSLSLVVVYRCRIYQHELRVKEIVTANGCLPPRKWCSAWPLGLDLLVKAFEYDRRQQILKFFLEVVARSGTTFEQSLLFAHGIDTIEPRNIQALLSTQFTDFGLGLRPQTFSPLLGSGIFTQDGTPWRHSRELLRPQFMTNRLSNFDQIKAAVEDLISSNPANDIVDLQPLFFRLTFETTLFLLFGQDLSTVKSKDAFGQESDFADAFNLAQGYLAKRGRLCDLYWLLGGKEFRRACTVCHEFFDDAVQHALDRAAMSTKPNVGERTGPYDRKALRDQCLNILLAGRDTTACCLTWTLRLLGQHPRVLSRLRAEISDTIRVGPEAQAPTITQLKTFTYLSLVIKEVLRLYPSVPVNSCTAIRTTTLPTGGGPTGTSPILVRKGEAVGYCVYAMHRRKDIYGPDADKFRPERWENDELDNVGWVYLPFNGGPRVCLGQEFAMLEAKYTVVRLLETFEHIEAGADRFDRAVGEERQVLTLVVRMDVKLG
ncbi:n-alkane-inducible cytochrome P450 [Aspergillus keveii]|uniref:N-alkane-inducible cytochrome P450 n=1 Tax=Aspergillus keveii TaxID=714993 RepID=A0ABR4FM55_9EURO